MSRMNVSAHFFGAAVIGLLSLSACIESPVEPAPDIVLLNGTVITVDGTDSIAQAVAVREGKIVAVGSSEAISDLAGPETKVIDLAGKTVTPGLIDAHCHFAMGGIDLLYEIDLSYPTVKNIDEVVQKVEAQAASLPEGSWISGRGWDEGKLAERRYIYASDLDTISEAHPVYLSHTMGHYGVANSRALQLAGITKDTPDPPGGTIDRLPDGSPSGVLKESAQDLVTRLVPPLTDDQRRAGIRKMVEEFNREGMTALKDPGIAEPTWKAYQDVLKDGGLTVRVFALWRGGDTLESTTELIERIAPTSQPRAENDSHLISGGVKLYADGSGGARTAWLYTDWNKNRTEMDTGNTGYPAIPAEVIRQQISAIHQAGLHMSVHSIGDRAIDWTVDSYAEALERTPTKGLRHGIIHSNIPTDHAIETMARLQQEFDAGYPEPSATFTWWIGDTYAGNFGAERSLRLNPFKTLLSRGIIWAVGSDFPVTPFPARYGLWASIARQPTLGIYGAHPFGVEEAVDVRTALRSATIWAARQMFLEDRIGSIEVGKFADLAVWDRDLYSVPAEQLKDAECMMTLFQGQEVFRSPKWNEAPGGKGAD